MMIKLDKLMFHHRACQKFCLGRNGSTNICCDDNDAEFYQSGYYIFFSLTSMYHEGSVLDESLKWT